MEKDFFRHEPDAGGRGGRPDPLPEEPLNPDPPAELDPKPLLDPPPELDPKLDPELDPKPLLDPEDPLNAGLDPDPVEPKNPGPLLEALSRASSEIDEILQKRFVSWYLY